MSHCHMSPCEAAMPCMPFLGVSSLDLGRAVQTCGPFFFLGWFEGFSSDWLHGVGPLAHMAVVVRYLPLTMTNRRDRELLPAASALRAFLQASLSNLTACLGRAPLHLAGSEARRLAHGGEARLLTLLPMHIGGVTTGSPGPRPREYGVSWNCHTPGVAGGTFAAQRRTPSFERHRRSGPDLCLWIRCIGPRAAFVRRRAQRTSSWRG